MNKKEIERAIFDVTSILCYLFEDIVEYCLDKDKEISFKVRPDYGPDKFFLNWVMPSPVVGYDMTLQSLINHILYEENHYKRIVSKETYGKLARFIERQPDDLYDFGNNGDEQDAIEIIYWFCINFMRCCFEEKKLDVSSFIDAGYTATSPMPSIFKCNAIDNRIVKNPYNFRQAIEKFGLNGADQKKLIILMNNLENINYLIDIAKVIYSDYAATSKEIIKIAITKVCKKSEYTRLSSLIENEKYFDDKKWAKEVLVLKNKI